MILGIPFEVPLNGSDVGPMLLGSRLCGVESFTQLFKCVCFLLPSTLYLDATKAVWQAIQGNWGQDQPLVVELVFGSTTPLIFFTINTMGADRLWTECRMSDLRSAASFETIVI